MYLRSLLFVFALAQALSAAQITGTIEMNGIGRFAYGASQSIDITAIDGSFAYWNGNNDAAAHLPGIVTGNQATPGQVPDFGEFRYQGGDNGVWVNGVLRAENAVMPSGAIIWEAGSVTLPDIPDPGALPPVPVSISGRFVAYMEYAGVLVDTPIDGTGLAYMQGAYDEDGIYFIRSTRFEFTNEAHAPEPATMLLAGSALLIIAWRMRR